MEKSGLSWMAKLKILGQSLVLGFSLAIRSYFKVYLLFALIGLPPISLLVSTL